MGDRRFFCEPCSQDPCPAMRVNSLNSVLAAPWDNPIFHAANMAV